MKRDHRCLISILLQIFGAIANAVAAPSWHKYVRGPPSSTVHPKAVLATNGSVTNAEGLISGEGIVTLSRPTTDSTVPSVLVDFGIDVVGNVQIHFAGASNNSPGIRLAFSETREYLTNVSDFTRSDNGDTITPGTDQFAVPATPTTWTDRHGCLHNSTLQVCADGLHGFRYVRLSLDALESDAPYTQPNGTVNITSIDLAWNAFLGTPDTYTGYFTCSDEALTQYWFDAAYTNEMVTDVFRPEEVDPRDAASPTLDGKLVIFDGAKRDRDPYSGDIAVSGRTAYLTHLNQTSVAAQNVIADLANHQRSDGWIPPASIDDYTLPLFDYPLYWVVTSWEYVLYSGDLQYAQEYFDNLVAVLDGQFYTTNTDNNGLLSKGLNGTEAYGDYAFLPRTGQVTYYNALYVLALQDAVSWATALNHSSSAATWSARAASVAEAINIYLWDDVAGAYLDSTNFTTSNGTARHAQDGNGIAVLAGVANSTRAASALTYLSRHTAQFYGNAFYDGEIPGVANATERVYAFISFFELQGRFKTSGFAASALEEIGRLYGWMTTHDPKITVWEGIGPGGMPYEEGYTSMAHGWSTGVVSLLSNYVLGIMPTGPGFQTWSIEPHTAGLQWAEGEVGTPYGPLKVSWSVSNGSGSGFELNVSSPARSLGVVSLPAGLGQQVYLNGDKEATSNCTSFNDGYITVEGVGGGSWTFNVH